MDAERGGGQFCLAFHFHSSVLNINEPEAGAAAAAGTGCTGCGLGWVWCNSRLGYGFGVSALPGSSFTVPRAPDSSIGTVTVQPAGVTPGAPFSSSLLQEVE